MDMVFGKNNRVLVQGITESLGAIYTPLMQAYGGQIVAGVSPGYGGEQRHGVPVFDLVEGAIAAVGTIDTSVIFVAPYGVVDAALEAISAGIRQLVLVTKGVPPLDMVRLLRVAERTETLVVGPNSPGLIVPGAISLGTHPVELYQPGRVGVLSRSGPLTYEVAQVLTQAGLGQSICVSIGSDAIAGSSFPQWLQILDEDEATDAIVLVGEIGGDSEEAAAHYIAEAIDKPVVAYVAGRTAPPGRRVGHAGMIIDAQILELGLDTGSADSKLRAFQWSNIPIADRLSEIPALVHQVLSE